MPAPVVTPAAATAGAPDGALPLLADFAAVRHRPQDATRLVLATQGLIPREAFFNPRNLQNLLGEVPSPAPPAGR